MTNDLLLILIGYLLSAGFVAGILLSDLAVVPMSKAYDKELTIIELNSVPAKNDKEEECEDSDDDDTNPCK
jgi:hypothetical protein